VGIVIRNKRLRKFRNKHWAYILTIKITAVFYITIFSSIALIGATNAYFNDTETLTLPLKTTLWWDKSSLEFIGEANDSSGVSATIKNGGDKMAGTVPYEVWFSPDENPKNGKLLAEGIVPILDKNEVYTLHYSTTQPGKYMFKAYQRPGHGNKDVGGNGNLNQELWSNEIVIPESPKKPKTIEEQPKEIPNPNDESDTTSEIQPTTPESPSTTPEAPEDVDDTAPEPEQPPLEEETTEDIETSNDGSESIEEIDETPEETQ
jgi:YqxM protein